MQSKSKGASENMLAIAKWWFDWECFKSGGQLYYGQPSLTNNTENADKISVKFNMVLQQFAGLLAMTRKMRFLKLVN